MPVKRLNNLSMLLYIKNMVHDRCIHVITKHLQNHNFLVSNAILGQIEIFPEPTDEEVSQIASELNKLGYGLIKNVRERLAEQIKILVRTQIHDSKELALKINFSTFLTSVLHKDYSYLSNLFSELEGTTIEKFIIQQKIERVKDLLIKEELNINEISYKLGYRSSAHLSSQFKKVTGATPSQFRTDYWKDKGLDEAS